MNDVGRALIAIAFACAVASGGVQSARAGDSSPGRVPTVTRLVKLFLEREDALAAAMSRGDAAALAQTLSDDFELRASSRAANPIPRADFIAAIERARPPTRPAGQMAVHEIGNLAIVSFMQGGDARTAVFVVDVWRREASDWKLAIRYAGPAGAPEFAIPGAGPPEPEIPKKY